LSRYTPQLREDATFAKLGLKDGLSVALAICLSPNLLMKSIRQPNDGLPRDRSHKAFYDC